MKRININEVKFNNSEWDIQGNQKNGYCFVDKKTYELYFISANILGLTQINSNSFFIYCLNNNQYYLIRLRLSNGKKIIDFKHSFRSIDWISDDLILFNRKSNKKTEIYCISKNICSTFS